MEKCPQPPELRRVTADKFFNKPFCVFLFPMLFMTVMSLCDGYYQYTVYEVIIIALLCFNNYLIIDRDNARLDLLDGYEFLSALIDATMSRKKEEKNKKIGE